jgi:hypothetical protein
MSSHGPNSATWRVQMSNRGTLPSPRAASSITQAGIRPCRDERGAMAMGDRPMRVVLISDYSMRYENNSLTFH